jgi:hypothetical protein
MAKASDLLFIPNFRSMKYPDISSCLTITLVCKNQMLVGAHAVIAPGPNMQGVDDLVQGLKNAAKDHNPLKLFLVGVMGIWNPRNLSQASKKYRTVDAIAEDLQKEWRGLKYSMTDVTEWTNNGAVEIKFSPSGPFVVRDQNTGSIRHQEEYGIG